MDNLSDFLFYFCSMSPGYSNLILFLIFALCGCTSAPEIEGFDQEMWQNDKKACLDNRKNLVKVLLAEKETLKGESDRRLLNLLGKPDQINQASRGKRYYIYFTESGSQCGNSQLPYQGKKLVIEVDALGRARMFREEGRQ